MEVPTAPMETSASSTALSEQNADTAFPSVQKWSGVPGAVPTPTEEPTSPAELPEHVPGVLNFSCPPQTIYAPTEVPTAAMETSASSAALSEQIAGTTTSSTNAGTASTDARGCNSLPERSVPLDPSASPRYPPMIPDTDSLTGRFAGRNKDRVYTCDSCAKEVKWNKGSVPFRGTYINPTWPPKTSPQELKEGYLRGDYDVSWWCLACIADRKGYGDNLQKAGEDYNIFRETKRRAEQYWMRATKYNRVSWEDA